MNNSLAAFYQESGRAGRDGESARSIVLYSRRDRQLLQFLLKVRFLCYLILI